MTRLPTPPPSCIRSPSHALRNHVETDKAPAARAPARSSRAPAPAPAPETSGAPAPALLSATEARNCELQRPQCSRRMRCSSGSCTETVNVRAIVAQSSARAGTMHTSNATRNTGLLRIDQARTTLARVPWRHVERARVRTPAERKPPSPEHTLHAHTRCREAASSGVREIATPGASMAASGRSSLARSIARRPAA